jgi:hypothetical protein
VTTVTPTGMTFVWTPPEESDDDLY